MNIREMTIADYDSLINLFKATPGITVRDADSRIATQYYLERNPHLSYVAEVDGDIIGCVMCGHDGRRGYLQHLLVKPEYRNNNIGTLLFSSCIAALKQIGIFKTHLFVLTDNVPAQHFWAKKGWVLRSDIYMYSYNDSGNDNI